MIRSYREKDGLKNTDLISVEEGLNGDILLGSDGNGIYIIDRNGSISNFDKKDGLTSGDIMRIKKDRIRDVFWIITEDSIAYMTKGYRITTVTYFPCKNNFDLYQNSKDEMWVLSGDGIYVVPTEQMLSNKQSMTCVYYGIANGLPRITTANSYSDLTSEGELYIAGNTGISKVNIDEAFQEPVEIKADVPFVEADGEMIYPDENGSFTIASDVIKLTVYAYVFNYSLTSPQITYRLEGLDSRETTVSQSALVPIDYTNLHGGKYSFVMRVTSPADKTGCTLSVRITKQKAYYEEVWFYILTGLLIVLMTVAAVLVIYKARMKKIRKKHEEEIEKELRVAELNTAIRIQNDMIPSEFPAFPDRAEFDIYAKMDPAKEVGGDFYDFFMIDDDHLCMMIADVSGKGIPAALFMMRSSIILRDFAMLSLSPADILTRANKAVCEKNKTKMFLTVWLGVLEISTGKLTAANAGHSYPALMKPDGRFELYKEKHGMVVGMMNMSKYKEYELMLEPGTKLFQYTDGVNEATNAENKLFGTDRMLEALNEDTSASPEQLLTNVRKAVDGFVMDAEQFDDLTMLCLEYKGRRS